MFSIHPVSAFSDNYIWCLCDSESGTVLVVDPGQAEPVERFLEARGLTLDTILVTHHHPDHTGGIRNLVESHPDTRVVGPADSPFKAVDRTVHPGDQVIWQGLTFDVMAVPGHTLDHIAYFAASHVEGRPVLFCGDTLFACGCGRLFEGTPEQMYNSLTSLRELPGETAVYCAHEYTLANLRFARHWLPDDKELAAFEGRCISLREKGQPTLPTTMEQERTLNPFLRWDDPEVIAAAETYCADNNLETGTPALVFAAVRHGKDNF